MMIYSIDSKDIDHKIKKIYEVQLEDFYTVVTGVNDALHQLYAVLPKLIKEIATKHVFISYSHHDNDHMEKVRDAFKNVDITWWVDENLIPGTADWMRSIQKAIEECGCLIVILSPNAKSSKWVSEEIEYATSQEKRIIPFLVSGNEQNAVPFGITKVQRIDATKDYQSALSKLALTVKDYLRDLRGT